MEFFDLTSLPGRARTLGEGARVSALYPAGQSSGGLVALDLLEVEAGASTPAAQVAEERFLCVLSGAGEIAGGAGGPVAQLRAGSVIRVAPREPHTLSAAGRETLRVLVVTPLVVLSDRALGIEPDAQPAPRERLYTATPPATREEPAQVRETTPTPEVEEAEEPRPDISGLMRRASELSGQPKPERRRPAPEAEPPPAPQPEPDVEEEAEDKGLMELLVVFDGGSRGNPGQGYGSYLVQSPGRKPVVKRAEFGTNHTNNQAEYDSLLAALNYIIDRLTATGRTPDGVALDIKTDSDLVANQLQGNYKVKDAGLKPRHAQAMELLDQFGAWQIEWQPREETVKLLGH